MQGTGSKTQANSALRDLGGELRRRREQLGRTIADAESTLKIRERYLTALEYGELQVFPGLVYQLGFLRAYGDYLGLNGEQLVVRCREAMQPPAAAAPAAVSGAASMTVSEPKRPAEPAAARPPARSRTDQPKPQVRPEPAHEPEHETVASRAAAGQRRRQAPASAAPTASRSAVRLVLVVLLLLAVVAFWYTIARAPSPPDGGSGSQPPPVSGDPKPPGGDPPPPPPPPKFGRDNITVLSEVPGEIRYQVAAETLEVTIRLTERVWIRVVADGEEIVADTFEPGYERVFTAVNQMSLRTGRAARTTCRVFDVDIGPAGNLDDARTVVFVRKQ